MNELRPSKRSCLMVMALLSLALWLYVSAAVAPAQGTRAETRLETAQGKSTASRPSRNDNSARLAKMVIIFRDTYGVPHVFGRTDASTVFGFACAQAQDNFWRVEENFISALGRLSEVYGEETVDEDRLNHALEIPRLAREEYARLDRHMRALCDAFAAGFNYFLSRHPEVRPRLLTRIEPWHTLAFIRYNYYQNGFSRDRNLRPGGLQTAQSESDLRPHVGSNGWVIAPPKARADTPCSSLTRIYHSSGRVRFTRDLFTAIKAGISPAIQGSGFPSPMWDTTKMEVGLGQHRQRSRSARCLL